MGKEIVSRSEFPRVLPKTIAFGTVLTTQQKSTGTISSSFGTTFKVSSYPVAREKGDCKRAEGDRQH
jgi:hypothetical protein